MRRKFLAAALALAALAVGSSSALATNTPTFTVPAGTVAAAGTKFVGTGSEVRFLDTSGSAVLSCTTSSMTAEVLKNAGGILEANITSVRFIGSEAPVGGEQDKACPGFVNASYTVTTPWCLRSTTTMKTDEFQTRGGKCSEAAKPIRFHMVTEAIGTCAYERAAGSPITGTLRTHPEQATLTINSTPSGSGFSKTEGSAFCPSSETLQLSFTLDDENGVPVYIDS